MKKIVFFIPRMGGGGAERVVAILANKFSEQHKVLIYTPTDSNSFYTLNSKVNIESAGYKVSKNKYLRLFFLGVNGIRLYFNFRKKMIKEKPDIVISFMNETNIIASLQFHRKYKLILSERNDPTRKSYFMQKIVRKLYPKADVLVCQTGKVAEYFNAKNCVVIANPLDCNEMEDAYEGERKKIIVSVGRLMPQKNFSMLINAFANLNNEYFDYKLKIYGEGILRESLQQQIDFLNLNDKVFLMGAVHNVMHEYRDAELFVMSSDYEGFPNALVEAMAMGLPVICTDFATGAARELVKVNNGLLVPVGDVQAMTEAMESILSDESKRNEMRKANLKIRHDLSVDKIVKEWEKLLSLNKKEFMIN